MYNECMKKRIFPQPVESYDVLKHIEQIEANRVAQLDHYPWDARALGVLFGMVLWGLIFAFIFGLWLGGAFVTATTLLCSFLIGAGLAFVFSVPFLWK